MRAFRRRDSEWSADLTQVRLSLTDCFPQQAQWPQPPQAQWQQPPQAQWSPGLPPPYQMPFPGYAAPPKAANVLSIIAFVLSAIALFVLPILFGPVAIVLGVIAIRRGEPLGKLARTLGGVATLAGIAFGIAMRLLL